MKFILIDNYDSFTYTIKDYFEVLQVKVDVIKHDDSRLLRLEKLAPDALILSPGPGNPDQAGYTLEVIKKYHQRYPILGVCLGHQSIAQAFGGRIIQAQQVMHGKQSPIYHTGLDLFHGVPAPFMATRYHSLVVEAHSLPKELDITAWTLDCQEENVIMGLRHRQYPLYGLQYHPEAILTEHGFQVFENFIAAVVRLNGRF